MRTLLFFFIFYLILLTLTWPILLEGLWWGCYFALMTSAASSPCVCTNPRAWFHVSTVTYDGPSVSTLSSGGGFVGYDHITKEGFALEAHSFQYPLKPVVGKLSFEKVKKTNHVYVLGQDMTIDMVVALSKRCLVGRFEYLKLSREAILSWVREHWRPLLKFVPKVLSLVNGWTLF